MNRILALVLLTIFVFGHPSILPAQTAAVSDAQATTLVAKSMAAMTGGVPVGDVNLTANVTWIAGSDNLSGTATLQAKGHGSSLVDLKLSNTERTELRTTQQGVTQGQWKKGATAAVRTAQHNLWTDAVWFFRHSHRSPRSRIQTIRFLMLGKNSAMGSPCSIFKFPSSRRAMPIMSSARRS